jgi:endonuclease/exonuclease/phosphatase (EEP) superfamily protein YafD
MSFLRLLIAFLAWLMALGALAAALLAQGGRVSQRLDVLTHFAPVYVILGVLALALATLAPRGGRVPLLATALVAVAASAALMAPELLTRDADGPAPAGPGRLKLVQFNAWGGNRTPQRAAEWIADQEPDIVVLEEPGKVRDLLIARGFHATCKGCGVIVLSRTAPIAERPREDGTRYLASATYERPEGDFIVVGVHRFWPVRFARDRAQTAALKAYLATLPKQRLILAGDFNSTPWSFARRREDVDLGLIRRTRALPTWPAAKLSHNRLPAPFPYLPIDHVYAGPGWATVKVERGPALGSDHYPVVVTLAPVDSGGT